MMGRGFYSPLHSMWGTAFGAAASATASASPQQSAKSYSTSFYPHHHQQQQQKDIDEYNSGYHSAGGDFKPHADHLAGLASAATASSDATCASSSSLTTSYGMHGGGGGASQLGGGGGVRKLPEGTGAASAAYPYYSSPELHAAASVYGMASPFAARSGGTFQSSSAASAPRPKPKSRTNAGEVA
jgi:hypothetical protein